jgi:predicted acylesterase/phospholipase RssA
VKLPVVDGELEVDGGILDNLPVDLMRERPVGRIIAVDVTSRRSHDVDYEYVPSPWVVLGGRMLPFMRRYKVPGTVSMLLMAMSIGSMESARKAGERADLLIKPDLGRFGFTDVRPYDQIVAAGYQAAQQALATASPTK